MAIPLLALAGLQAVGSISTSIMQASAIKSEASFLASQYERNAQLAEFQAKESIKEGETAAQQRAQQVKKLIGRQRATAAAQGIEVNADSALDLQAEAAGFGALDIVTIRNNAWKQAWGYRVDSANNMSQARLTLVAGKYGARQTLLTGGMQAALDIAGGMAKSKGSLNTGSKSIPSANSMAKTLVYGR